MYISLPEDDCSQFLRGLKDSRYVLYQHRCEIAEFENIARGYDEEKRNEAEELQQTRRFPFKSNHVTLARRIRKQLNKMCHGDTRTCVQCKSDVGWFQYHSICLNERDSSPTCSSLIPDMIYNQTGRATRIIDPRLECESVKIVDANPSLWSPFILNLFLEILDDVLRKQNEVFLNCRRFEDWWALRVDAKLFGTTLESVLEAMLEDEELEMPEEFLKSALQIATGMFVMDKQEVQQWNLRIEDEDEHDDAINVYWRSCYDRRSIISNADFVDFWMNNCEKFAYNNFSNIL